MSRAPVSVIIPSYNCGRYLPDALDSVLAQTRVPAQIIVVDDGSTDDTAAQVAPYLGRVEYIVQANTGPSAARNRGIRAAGEAMIAFLDADDVWHPAKIEMQERALERRPDLHMLGTATFDWPTRRFPRVEGADCPAITELSWEAMAVRTMLLTSSTLVRRGAVERAGDFDLWLRGPEDRDFFLRVASFAGVGVLDVPLTGYRAVPGSVSRQAVVCEVGMRRILRKLDASRAWRGRSPLLRTKAYSYLWYGSALNFAAAGAPGQAAWRLIKSLLRYPFAYTTDEAPVRFARLQSLVVQLLRCAQLKAPVPAPRPTFDGEVGDALEPLRGQVRCELAGVAAGGSV